MFDFCRANAERECTECAVSGGVAVAAHDGQTGEGDSQLWADDVDDALLFVAVAEEGDAEFLAVFREGSELLSAEGRLIDRAAVGGDVVVDGSEGEIGAADGAVVLAEAVEGLGGSDFVDEVAVDIEEGAAAGEVADDVGVPDLVE